MTRAFTEHIGVDTRGRLCEELGHRPGRSLRHAPVRASEQQIRHNVRAITTAFRERYPRTAVFFSNKANNNPAVRRVFNLEGAGGDCFGYARAVSVAPRPHAARLAC